MVNDGAMFGAAGRGFVRLNFGTSRRILKEIVDRWHGRSRAEGAYSITSPPLGPRVWPT